MEQKSNVRNRAEKIYKNSREKFYFLLREVLSNSIQAVLIRKEKEMGRTDYIPRLVLEIALTEKECTISLEDNGEGFTENNSSCFDELDKKNEEKAEYRFHPLGQGRLAIVYFSDWARYETVYRDRKGELKKKAFPYPRKEGLFNLFEYDEESATEKDSYTKLEMGIYRQQSLSRAQTFFKKYATVDGLVVWFVETFFPYIVANKDLTVSLSFNGEERIINRESIESTSECLPFSVSLETGDEYNFKLWLIPCHEKLQGDNPIVCFARNLKAELGTGKLSYTIDSDDGYLLYLTSDFFDEFVDIKGERIEISSDAVAIINERVNLCLDQKFKNTIAKNKERTHRNFVSFQKKYPSLNAFVPEDGFTGSRTIIKEDDLVKRAIETKGRIEKKFWAREDALEYCGEKSYEDSVECQKLLNSSLHVYVKHRERVLARLHHLIRLYDDDMNPKPELENSVHELLFKRGAQLQRADGINHLHNLWILDDKFTTFSDSFKAKSTIAGKSLSDIYIWADNPEEIKQVLILELKSTTKAHNAGSKEEGMIAQVKRYAKAFYSHPTDIVNWDIDTSAIQIIGIILARKSDINKELTSDSAPGQYYSIPFLKDSFIVDDSFVREGEDPRKRVPIRIELYSFEDIYHLAAGRNEVFFRLLKNEFSIGEVEQE